jgi:rod shape-determining protein MreD
MLNEVNLGVYVNPYLYVMFIIVLPFETPNWLLMLSAFLMGLLLDSFSNTLGLHASACVFIAYMRPAVLRFMKPRDGYETGKHPTLFSLGATWFMYYAAVVILLHHLWFFFLEFFRLSDSLQILLKVLCSSIATWLLVMLAQLLTANTKSE